MTPLLAHGRIAALCDAGFKDWHLNIDARHERLVTTAADWPCNAAALADLSGGLEDLPDDADDNALLELVRHGMFLWRQGIISEQQMVDAHNAVLHEVMRFGEAVEAQLSDVASNN